MKSPQRVLAGLLMLLVVGASLVTLTGDATNVAVGRPALWPGDEAFIGGLSDSPATLFETASGPIVTQVAAPYVWNGDLRDLVRDDPSLPRLEIPRPGTFDDSPLPSDWPDPLAQTWQGIGQMPTPLMNFQGLNRNDGGGWRPPDTNGDVGPDHYIQTVNIALGIYDKDTGLPLVVLTYNEFFQGPPGSSCENHNSGDVIALYDPLADRWMLSDFSLPSGQSRQCIAVSQTGDPVSGGWYFYDVNTKNVYGSWCDYPKLGVWPDAYYMSCNMFQPSYGAKVFALNRDQMLAGLPVDVVSFDLGTAYWSLLPANMKGALPPAGAPNYFTAISSPSTLRLWEFRVDWDNPGQSTFIGPLNLAVAPFTGAPWTWIPQPGTDQQLDSIGDRLMFSLHYRNMGDYESLWVNHTVQSNGVAGVRWYEVRDPGGTPVVYQQGTFQPDQHYRWMGSVATDQDGNMALGYSVSSSSLYPAIRYAGRLNGETLGLLTQGETSLYAGTGSQTGSNRWGDYSLMTVDPVDDCTFWFTSEYLATTGGLWLTRIGSFRFPSCGEPKGWIAGTVYSPGTGEGIPGAPVVAVGAAMVMSVETDAAGHFRLPLLADAYTLTAGPLLPAYPDPAVVPDVVVTTGSTTTVNIPLLGLPHLEGPAVVVDDDVAGGNGNGYPEPGETGLLMWVTITNTGASTATNVTAHLTALTPGVVVTTAEADYPDFGIGEAWPNLAPFVFALDPAVPCGERLNFQQVVTTDQGSYTIDFSLAARVPLPLVHVFTDDMESGPGDWTPGGTPNLWAITEERSHSPTHAWSDSPYANYGDNSYTWLRSPALNLTEATGTQLTFWHWYWLEADWDFLYAQYSLTGGNPWQNIAVFTGQQDFWGAEHFELPALDGQSNVMFRFVLTSDSNTNYDGWHLDDVDLFYQPFACYYLPPAVPILLAPPDGTVTANQSVTFTWAPAPGGGTAEGYNLELDGGAVYTTTDPSLGLSLPVGLHTWRVRAYHSAGVSDYTSPWTVEVQDLPAVPELLAPPDGSLFTTTLDVTLTWQAGAGYAPDSYDLDLDGAVYNVTATTYPATLDAGDHAWRVRACNTAGCSDYTPAWSLTILDAPVTPTLVYPPDGSLFTTTHDITLTWQAGTGSPPDAYDLDLDGTVYPVTGTTYPVTLDAGDHTWQVRACNAAGCSAYTPAWSLTILDAPLTPTLVYPPDGALITTTPAVAFTWEAGAGSPPGHYYLEVNGVVYTATDTVYTVTLPAGPFTWRVQAVNAAGASDYTAPWSGAVVLPAGVPTLLAPADGTVTTTTVLTFAWQAGAGGAPDGYHLELGGTVITTTGTIYTATLAPGEHTWRVRAYNAAGHTDYTAAWTVTVREVVIYRFFLPVLVK